MCYIKTMTRIEKDFLGEKEIARDALYGIHSVRAKENFPDNSAFHLDWYKAIGLTKMACYLTYNSLKKAIDEKYPEKEFSFQIRWSFI